MLEKIKSVLGDLSEQVEKVLTEAKIELAIMNDGSVVPADKHDTLKTDLITANTKLDDANKQVTTLTGQIKELGNTDDIEQLKADIKKANEDAETYKTDAEKRILNIQKTSALQAALIGANADAQNIDLLISQFDMDKINLTDDGKVVGFDDIVKPIQEKRSALFIKTEIEGVKPNEASGITPATREALISEYDKAEIAGDVSQMRAIDTKIKELKKE